MSLEAAIEQNTAAVRELQTAIQSFVQLLSAAGTPVATVKAPRAKKTEVAVAAEAAVSGHAEAAPTAAAHVEVPTPAPTQAPVPAAVQTAVARPAAGTCLPAGHPMFPVNAGDHPNTRYFYDSRSDTAFAWSHEMPEPTLRETSVQVSGPEYLQKQAEIAQRHPTAAKPQATAPAAQPAPVPTAAPTPAPAVPAPEAAATTPTAAAVPAAVPTPSASPTAAAPTAKDLTDRLMALFKAKGPASVQKILAKHGVASVPALVSKPDLSAVAEDIAAAEA